jgi:hypothetical protein
MIWAGLLRRAAREFGLRPAEVWRLSLREWRALVEPAFGQPLSRTDFERLAAAHPDRAHPDRARTEHS